MANSIDEFVNPLFLSFVTIVFWVVTCGRRFLLRGSSYCGRPVVHGSAVGIARRQLAERAGHGTRGESLRHLRYQNVGAFRGEAQRLLSSCLRRYFIASFSGRPRKPCSMPLNLSIGQLLMAETCCLFVAVAHT